MPSKTQSSGDIYIIVLNYNQYQLTKECLESIEKLDSTPSYKVIMVDNHSTDDSFSKLKANFSQFHFIKNKDNLGFAGGNNQGILYARKHNAKAVFLINNDTVLTDPHILNLLDDSNLDIAGPVVLYKKDGKKMYDFGGKLDYVLGRNTHFHHLPAEKKAIVNRDYVSGVAMFIRKPVLDSIGLLDDNFFFYYEDADYCVRAAKKGYKIGIVINTQIFHHLSASIDTIKGRKLSWLTCSHFRFINKHIGNPQRLLAYAFNVYLRLK